MRLLLPAAAAAAWLLVPPMLWAQAPVKEPSWSISVGVREEMASRVLMSAASDQGDLVSRLNGGFSYNHVGQKLQLGLAGTGSGLFYKNLNDLNRFSFAGGLSGAYVSAPRFKVTFADTVTDAYTYDTPVLVENGTLLPLVHSLTNRALADIEYQFSRRTSLIANVRHDKVKFDSSALVSGSRLSADTEFRRQVSASQSLGIVYGFSRYSNRDRITYLNTLSGAWVVALNRWLEANVALGVGRLQDNVEAEARTLPVATAGVTTHFQHTSAGVRYHRSAYPAYGLGQNRLVDAIALDLNQKIARNLNLRATASFAVSSDPYDSNVRAYSQNDFADLSYDLSRKLSVVGGYIFRSRKVKGPTQGIHSNGAHLSLSYGLKW
jgi:hypothetical protein